LLTNILIDETIKNPVYSNIYYNIQNINHSLFSLTPELKNYKVNGIAYFSEIDCMDIPLIADNSPEANEVNYEIYKLFHADDLLKYFQYNIPYPYTPRNIYSVVEEPGNSNISTIKIYSRDENNNAFCFRVLYDNFEKKVIFKEKIDFVPHSPDKTQREVDVLEYIVSTEPNCIISDERLIELTKTEPPVSNCMEKLFVAALNRGDNLMLAKLFPKYYGMEPFEPVPVEVDFSNVKRIYNTVRLKFKNLTPEIINKLKNNSFFSWIEENSTREFILTLNKEGLFISYYQAQPLNNINREDEILDAVFNFVDINQLYDINSYRAYDLSEIKKNLKSANYNMLEEYIIPVGNESIYIHPFNNFDTNINIFKIDDSIIMNVEMGIFNITEKFSFEVNNLSYEKLTECIKLLPMQVVNDFCSAIVNGNDEKFGITAFFHKYGNDYIAKESYDFFNDIKISKAVVSEQYDPKFYLLTLWVDEGGGILKEGKVNYVLNMSDDGTPNDFPITLIEEKKYKVQSSDYPAVKFVDDLCYPVGNPFYAYDNIDKSDFPSLIEYLIIKCEENGCQPAGTIYGYGNYAYKSADVEKMAVKYFGMNGFNLKSNGSYNNEYDCYGMGGHCLDNKHTWVADYSKDEKYLYVTIEGYSDLMRLKVSYSTIYTLKENDDGSFCVVSVNDGKFIYSWDSDQKGVKKVPVHN
jgi:hypothetical protein